MAPRDTPQQPQRRSPRVKKAVKPEESEEKVVQDEEKDQEKPRKVRRKRQVASSEGDTSSSPAIPDNTDLKPDDDPSASPKKKKRAPKHQVLTEKTNILPLWDPTQAPKGSLSLKIASWNVAGLRALIQRSPNALSDLVRQHGIDILCLQETKIQEQHVEDPKLAIPHLEEEGYQAYFSCSTERKGYSGTAVYVRNSLVKQPNGSNKRQATIEQLVSEKKNSTKKGQSVPIDVSESPCKLENVSYKMGVEKHDSEGRIIVLDFSLFTLCNVYVPNSGQELNRLSYRTEEWDKDFLSFMQKKRLDRGTPVLWTGDLNVAHTPLDVWNDGAKHLDKQAGVTPQERASFQEQLDAGFVDAFRKLHPSAGGHYSYWSMRAGNRPANKGLRLDYFICDPAMFDDSSDSKVFVRDSYMLCDQEGSDHCPIVLLLEVKEGS